MKRVALSLFFLLFITNNTRAESPVNPFASLIKDVEVVSVSKRPENSFQAASAIYTISRDDIRRSGATSIPEVLRLVPGLEVARIDSNKWAITSRGFNRQFANKLLVMIDGRTVYTPLFSGTYWDVRDALLEDVERIEVIRGPGATLWGANAVNGVINIITSDSRFTQGTYISSLIGNEEKGTVEARYGSKVGKDLYYRVYGKYFKRDEAKSILGGGASDEWENGRVGFRMDWDKSSFDSISIHGDIFNGYNEQPLLLPGFGIAPGDEDTFGTNIVLKWDKVLKNNSNLTFQFYTDYIEREISVLTQRRLTFDFDLQHNWKINKTHELIWGMGYRFFENDTKSPSIGGTVFLTYTPPDLNASLYSAFIQDKITLLDEKLYLIVGSKFSHNYYTDFEYQPNFRVVWLPTERQTVWGSVSRSIRIPSIAERSLLQVATPVLKQVGNPTYDSEELIAYEVGYRNKIRNNLSIDATAFLNDYDELRSFKLEFPDVTLENKGYGEVYGLEVAVDWWPMPSWNLSGSYSISKIELHLDSGTPDLLGLFSGNEEASPHNQFKIQSRVNLPHNIEFDTFLYFTDNVATHGIDSHLRVDARVSWKPKDFVELSLVAQNLFDDQNREFGPSIFSIPTEIERSIYGKISLRF